MKKIISVLLALLLVTGCKGPNETKDNVQEFQVITSFYPIYIFTKNVVGNINGVTVTNMTPPQTGCLHDYALLPADVRLLEKANVFVINGAGMEGYLDDITEQTNRLTLIDASSGCSLLKDEHTGEENAHIWLSVPNAIKQVENICAGLARADEKNAQQYRKNADVYIEKLTALHKEITSKLAPYKGREIVTFHEAFPYFAEEYGLNVAAVMNVDPDSGASAKEVANTIETIKEKNIQTIFTEPGQNEKLANSIAEQTGTKVYVLDPIVTGDLSPDAYVNGMKKNLETLLLAFSQE